MSVSSVYLSLFILVKLYKLRLISARLIPSGQLRFVFSSSCSSKNFFSFLSLLFFSCFFRARCQGEPSVFFCEVSFRAPRDLQFVVLGDAHLWRQIKLLSFVSKSRGAGVVCWWKVEYSSLYVLSRFSQDSIALHLFVGPECEPPSPRESWTGCSSPETLSAVTSWHRKWICSSTESLKRQKVCLFFLLLESRTENSK